MAGWTPLREIPGTAATECRNLVRPTRPLWRSPRPPTEAGAPVAETLSPPATSVAARAVGASKIYGSGEAEVRALDGISVEFQRSRLTAIMGPSGSGKSTLLHCLAGLDRLTSGEIYLGDALISSMGEKQLTVIRRDKLGFIFQSYNLIPTLDALENMTLPMSLAGRKPDPQWLDTVVDTVRTARPALAPPGGALGWPAAARRGRPRAAQPSRDRVRRRTHRQPRLALGR